MSRSNSDDLVAMKVNRYKILIARDGPRLPDHDPYRNHGKPSNCTVLHLDCTGLQLFGWYFSRSNNLLLLVH